ncbi:hypothetical protein B0A48_04220 [Cryoendolithus antarcticus]|uniref:Uncharacterized protein n=1 Tax=Cryoendolithus antarcticus TaxID=1507870 RepID=A0A1V8TF29_9PEZI|nr:hypothetical protein B0A48_04220 [Cryoendolithus antarcticus]
MTEESTQREFRFIVVNGPNTAEDPGVRTAIRKQAAKDVVAARKKVGNRSRVNVGQYPEFDALGVLQGLGKGRNLGSIESAGLDTEPSTEATQAIVWKRLGQYDRVSQPSVRTQPVRVLPSPLAVNPTNGYEALRAKYSFDISDLSNLTMFSISRSTIAAITRNSDLLYTLPGKQNASYLSLVPARQGHKPYLDAVIECVIAKARSAFSPPNAGFAMRVMKLHTRALRAIQQAVGDEKASRDADLLCAVQMLSLYELSLQVFLSGKPSAFIHHVNGSANLMRHRSPSSFTTPYEQMLFLAHIGLAHSEAFYKGEECYLTQPEWISLYESLAEETSDLTDRSPVVIRMRIALLHSPGMIAATSRALSSKGQCDPDMLLALELKTRELHQDVLDCIEEYKDRLLRTTLTGRPEKQSTTGREALGSALECLGLYKRMLAALSEPDRLALEIECQAVALTMLQMSDQPLGRQSWVHTGIEHGVALAIQETRKSWEENLSDQSWLEQRLASRKRWQTFHNHLMQG